MHKHCLFHKCLNYFFSKAVSDAVTVAESDVNPGNGTLSTTGGEVRSSGFDLWIILGKLRPRAQSAEWLNYHFMLAVIAL